MRYRACANKKKRCYSFLLLCCMRKCACKSARLFLSQTDFLDFSRLTIDFLFFRLHRSYLLKTILSNPSFNSILLNNIASIEIINIYIFQYLILKLHRAQSSLDMTGHKKHARQSLTTSLIVAFKQTRRVKSPTSCFLDFLIEAINQTS